MTFQPYKPAKTRFCCKITNENYDFLYQVSKRRDISLARVINQFIEKARNGDITICQPSEERVNVNSNGRRSYA